MNLITTVVKVSVSSGFKNKTKLKIESFLRVLFSHLKQLGERKYIKTYER